MKCLHSDFLSIDVSEANNEFSPGEIDPPPIPSTLPTYENSFFGHEFEIMKNFYIAYAQDVIEFRRLYFQRHRQYLIECPEGFVQSLGRSSKLFIWLYRYFYRPQILQTIAEYGLERVYLSHLFITEERLYRMQNNLWLYEDLPDNWREDTWYKKWVNSESNLTLLEAASSAVEEPLRQVWCEALDKFRYSD